jgi:hypothetical protein
MIFKIYTIKGKFMKKVYYIALSCFAFTAITQSAWYQGYTNSNSNSPFQQNRPFYRPGVSTKPGKVPTIPSASQQFVTTEPSTLASTFSEPTLPQQPKKQWSLFGSRTASQATAPIHSAQPQQSYWERLKEKGTKTKEAAKEAIKNKAYWAGQYAQGYKNQAQGAFDINVTRPLKEKAYWTGQNLAGYKDLAVGAVETRYKNREIYRLENQNFKNAFNNLKGTGLNPVNKFSYLFKRNSKGFFELTPKARAEGWELRRSERNIIFAVNPRNDEDIFLSFNTASPGAILLDYKNPQNIRTAIFDAPGQELYVSTNLDKSGRELMLSPEEDRPFGIKHKIKHKSFREQ